MHLRLMPHTRIVFLSSRTESLEFLFNLCLHTDPDKRGFATLLISDLKAFEEVYIHFITCLILSFAHGRIAHYGSLRNEFLISQKYNAILITFASGALSSSNRQLQNTRNIFCCTLIVGKFSLSIPVPIFILYILNISVGRTSKFPSL